jgi:hypothetical protein
MVTINAGDHLHLVRMQWQQTKKCLTVEQKRGNDVSQRLLHIHGSRARACRAQDLQDLHRIFGPRAKTSQEVEWRPFHSRGGHCQWVLGVNTGPQWPRGQRLPTQ